MNERVKYDSHYAIAAIVFRVNYRKKSSKIFVKPRQPVSFSSKTIKMPQDIRLCLLKWMKLKNKQIKKLQWQRLYFYRSLLSVQYWVWLWELVRYWRSGGTVNIDTSVLCGLSSSAVNHVDIAVQIKYIRKILSPTIFCFIFNFFTVCAKYSLYYITILICKALYNQSN